MRSKAAGEELSVMRDLQQDVDGDLEWFATLLAWTDLVSMTVALLFVGMVLLFMWAR